MRRVVAHVSGHVQGVGCRWFVSGLARPAGLTGYARNSRVGGSRWNSRGTTTPLRACSARSTGPAHPGP